MTKPTVFNYANYERLQEENERLKDEIANLQIRCRIAEADRKKGKWTNEAGEIVKDKYSVFCDQCNEWSEYRTNFCGNCGARMKDGED